MPWSEGQAAVAVHQVLGVTHPPARAGAVETGDDRDAQPFASLLDQSERAAGADIGEALRRAKLRMLKQFGPEAVPKLWSGVLVNGDASTVLKRPSTRAETGGANAR